MCVPLRCAAVTFCVVDLIESCCCCCFFKYIFVLFCSQFVTLNKFAGGRDSHPIGTLRVCFRILSPPVKAIQKLLHLNCVLKIVFHAFLYFVLFPRPFFGDCTRLKKKHKR
uniref:(northern house mosquito) hypothetical protein n=1 Tax=Culex pipiens TaxID=7175 RepID=A0A8D8CTL8_CULPI